MHAVEGHAGRAAPAKRFDPEPSNNALKGMPVQARLAPGSLNAPRRKFLLTIFKELAGEAHPASQIGAGP